MQRVWHRKHDNWWYATVSEAGRQKQLKLHKGPDTPSERSKAEQQLILQLADRLQSEPEAPALHWVTVGHVVTGFLAHSARDHDTTTYEWYRRLIQGFGERYTGLKVNLLRKKHVVAYVKAKYTNPTSQNKCVGAIKRAFNWAVEEEHIPRNPVAHVRKPRCQARDRVLEPGERALILSSIRDDAFREFCTALFLTGCRPGEVAKVTAANVDAANGVWVLPEHKTAKKTGKPRVVYLTQEMAELSNRLVAEHPDGPLFLNRRGRRWRKDAIRLRFQRLRKKCPQLGGVVAYTARHSYATDALERGVPDADVAALMGHTGTAVLHTWYSKLSQRRQHLRAAATRATDGGPRGTPPKTA
jgi:integrase